MLSENLSEKFLYYVSVRNTVRTLVLQGAVSPQSLLTYYYIRDGKVPCEL
jgi:hypothetical protein